MGRGYRRWQGIEPQVWAVYLTISLLSVIHLGTLLLGILTDFDLISIFGVSGSAIAQGQVYRLVTAVLFHLGLFHLLMNMLVLYLLGTVVETLAGALRFFVIFIVAGLTGSAFSALLNQPHVISVGASGAIMGYLGYIIASKVLDPRSIPQAISQWAISLLLINLFINLTNPSGLDVWGHAGGFVGGALAVGIVGLPTRFWLVRSSRFSTLQWLRAAGMVLVVGAIVYAPLTSLPPGMTVLDAALQSGQQIQSQLQRQQARGPGDLGRWAWEPDSYAQVVSSGGLRSAFAQYADGAGLSEDEREEQWEEWRELGEDRQVVLVHLFTSNHAAALTDLQHNSVGLGRAYLENDQGVVVDAAEIEYFPVEQEEEPYYGVNLLSFPTSDQAGRALVDADTQWIRLQVWTGRGDLVVRFET